MKHSSKQENDKFIIHYMHHGSQPKSANSMPWSRSTIIHRRNIPVKSRCSGAARLTGELDSVDPRPQCLSFLVAINYDSIVGSAKAIGLRGVFCEKVRERFQDRDAMRSGFRLLRSRPRRKHSRVSRRSRRTMERGPDAVEVIQSVAHARNP